MKKYVLTGKLRPENQIKHSLSVPKAKVTLFMDNENNFEFELEFEIKESIITANVYTEMDIPSPQIIRQYVNYVISHHTDAYGFLEGRWLEVELTQMVGDEKTYNFDTLEEGLNKSKSGLPIKNLNEIIPLLDHEKNELLRRALKDFRHAIKYQQDTAVYCYRAIEDLMQFFAKNNTNDERRKAWNKLNSSLNIAKSFVDKVADFALDPRHGRPKKISYKERIQILTISRNIIARFIIFIKTNQVPLESRYYPELN